MGRKGTHAYIRAPIGSRLLMVRDNSCEAIVEARKTAWTFLINDPDRIRSIGTREWACVSLEAGWYHIPR